MKLFEKANILCSNLRNAYNHKEEEEENKLN